MLRQLCRKSPTAAGNLRTMLRTQSTEDAAAADGPVLFNEPNRHCGIVTLNRPKALNALNLEMVRAIQPVLQRWQSTKSLVVVRSDLPKAFCAGGDVRSLVGGPIDGAYAFFREEYTLNHLIGTYAVPYVAIISGITMGGGVGLSVHGRYRVATERTMFAMPETLIGLFPDVGGSHFLPRLAGELGTYLGLTGARLKGREVLAAGIATHYCASERLDDLQAALLECRGPDDVQRTLDGHCAQDAQAAAETSVVVGRREQIDRCFGADSVEEIVRALEREGSEWARETLAQLAPTSPLSLKVTLRLLRQQRGATLAECLRVEHRLGRRHAEASDFAEGVRAMLIDRDNAPKWQYADVAAVPEERVAGFFEPLARDVDELSLAEEATTNKSSKL